MVLRASAADVWTRCTVSPTRPQKESQDTKWSRDGSRAHKLTEMYLNGLHNPMASLEELSQRLGELVEPAIRENALKAYDYVRSLNKAQLETIARCEYTFTFNELPEGVGGTLDYMQYDVGTRVLHIVDYKFGYVPVEVRDNRQLLVYSLGAYNFLGLADTGVEYVMLHVFQPHDYIYGAEKTHVYSFESWCRAIEEYVMKPLTAIQSGQTELRTGRHCCYCKARHGCKEFFVWASELSDSSLENLSSMLDLDEYALSAVYRQLLETERLVKSACSTLKDEILQRIENGRQVPGWSSRTIQGKKYMTKDVDKLRGLGALFGMQLTRETPVTLTEARQIPGFKGIENQVVTQGSGWNQLVPVDLERVKKIFNKETKHG